MTKRNVVDFDELARSIDDLLAAAREHRYPRGLLSQVSPQITEVAAISGFDYVVVNQEHTVVTGNPLLAEHLRAAYVTGIPTFVKLNTFTSIAARDALDLGAIGLQVPFVGSADKLREVFEAVRYPPFGHRGICVAPRAAWWGLASSGDIEQMRKFVEFSNAKPIIVPMLENAEALENLDEILAVPDLHVIGLGPLDLALSLGIGEEHLAGDPEARGQLGRALRIITEKAHAAGKLVMGPVTFDSHEEFMFHAEIDMPYFADMGCLGFGLDEAARRQQLAQRLRAETVDKKAAVAK